MALKRRLPKLGGGCCCGGGDNVTCGTPCSACGGVTIIGGYVVDDLGTHPLTRIGDGFGVSLLSGNGGPCSVVDSYCNFIGTVASCSSNYGWHFSCNPSTGTIILEGGEPEWAVYAAVIGGVWTPFLDSNACGESGSGFTGTLGPVSCSGTELTISLTAILPRDPCVWAFGQPPCGVPTWAITHGTAHLTIEVPRPQICCLPCPIPKQDLTLTYTIDGGAPTTTTLVWDSGSSTWSDGTNTLSCAIVSFSPVTRFHDARGNHDVPINATCRPLHLEYSYSSGGHTYDAKIDE